MELEAFEGAVWGGEGCGEYFHVGFGGVAAVDVNFFGVDY